MKSLKVSRYHDMVRQFETFIIIEELKKFNGNVCKTAESFGVHRNSLTRNIDKLGINLEEIKHGTNGRGMDKDSTLADGEPTKTGEVPGA